MAPLDPHDASVPTAFAPTVTPAASSTGGHGRIDLDLAPLEQVGRARYQPGELIGRGGMGEVRRARDLAVGREVAMKVMRPDAAEHPDVVARFLTEARVQGQLEHPAIVPVYDLGVGADGAPYFTMKRLRGLTLEAILDGLRRGDPGIAARYSRRKLLDAFADVCLAVEFAHTRGVLHRDLKPSNVMLGDFGEVYVLDWGVAKIAGAAEAAGGPDAPAAAAPEAAISSGGARTAAGAVLGTPGYMAPEQLEGRTGEVDARADVYALGAILFEILALEPLHPRGGAAVIESTLRGPDARPSARGRDVPPELDAICVRATARDREARYASARELHDAVEGYLDGDRDLARRRELAAAHAARAEAAADRALAGGPDARAARAEAVREAGRALALDPEDASAPRTLARLMLEPPAEAPPEVERDLEAMTVAWMRHEARAASWSYMTWLAFIPCVLWMGTRSMPLLVVTLFGIVGLAGVSWLISRSNVPRPGMLVAVAVANAALLATLSGMFGPFVLVPGVAAASTILFAMNRSVRRPALMVTLGCASVAAPLALEQLGFLPASYLFGEQGMTLVPRGVNLPELPVLAMLFFASMGTIIVPSVAVRRVLGALRDAERRQILWAWHLRQLVPEGVRGALATPEPPPPESGCGRLGDLLGSASRWSETESHGS